MEEFTDCRIDHYQTPANVNVSIFAKQVDKGRSTVVFESEKVYLRPQIDHSGYLDGQTDDMCAASLIVLLIDPHRFVSARWQAFQAFSRLVWRDRSRYLVVQGFRDKGTAGTFEPTLDVLSVTFLSSQCAGLRVETM